MFRSKKLLSSRCFLPAILAAVALFCVPHLFAQVKQAPSKPSASHLSPGDLLLSLQPSETLLDVVKRELAPPHNLRSLTDLNGITNPLHLAPGRQILIPAAWRKPKMYKATVTSVDGQVQTETGLPISIGSALGESDVVRTGPQSVVVLKFIDGTLVRIPSVSQVRIERLRGYHGSEAIDARMTLEKGSIEVQSESSRLGQSTVPGRRQFQIQTPRATASVRGTYFRIASDEAQSAAEVLDGAVEWAGSTEVRALPGGFGVLADNQGKLGPNEKLLPRSAALLGSTRSLEVDSEFEFASVVGAKQYLVETARDPQFSSLLNSAVQRGSKTLVRSEIDGPLYLKVRAISEAGLSGYDAQFEVDFAARPVYPRVTSSEPAGLIFQKSARLNWNGVQQANQYRVQVASDETFSQLVSDERIGQASYGFALQTPITDVTPYFWRVASIDSGKQGPWGGMRKLEFAPLMEAAKTQVGENSVGFEWTGKPGQQFEVQLSENEQFARLVKAETVKGVSWQVASLLPGQYQMRIRQIFSNGVTGPYSPAVKFEILSYLRDGSGQSIKSGTGKPVELVK